MNKIIISNFKGFGESVEIDFSIVLDDSVSSTNMILYSENGGGKTTIAEAIRLMAFPIQIENKAIDASIVDEERIAAKRDWINGYLHDLSTESFEINIDGVAFSNGLPLNTAGVFILSRDYLLPTSQICIDKLLDNTCFSYILPLSELLSRDVMTLVLEDVTHVLQNDFKESISLSLHESGDFTVGISGIIDGLLTNDINIKLNEAQQNLIKILIFLSYIKLLPKLDTDKRYFIVFDDIVSSLDLSNRIVLARIISDLGKDSNFQLLVMTHNAGFYNLMRHLINTSNCGYKWQFKSMFQIGNAHHIYSTPNETSVDVILEQFNGRILPNDELAINAIRKKFESLLHEFSKILTLGVQEETIDIISKISNIGQGYYCHINGNKICTHFDLLNEINSLISVCPTEKLQPQIRKLLLKYNDGNQMPWISNTINSLHTFQKVILHQGSHDHPGVIPVISAKEITLTIDLMKKLEQIVNRNSSSYPYFL